MQKYTTGKLLDSICEKACANANADMRKKGLLFPDDVDKVIIRDNQVIVVLKNGKRGVSACMDGDTNDSYVGFCIAYYKAKNGKSFEIKNALHRCVESARKKSYKQAIFLNK